ncbi:sensor histidine kinase [Sphaerochaeta globosa]|uniref:Integral membrane sensor signal transduction histidine kinase n=1 Tax=Sphaerochaeta globosa (strain ATCC BAA-1886 / DSM 22777 / Buddy) TaxID=158189 RepID=F0RTC0_SPHGB|nr:sensor histidine kinase [Sphaerochaeta globosa]ADY14463.1 integral membrane sensor signal transduction histidine kinase [Sphaerochaeta globosa str. Buddy]
MQRRVRKFFSQLLISYLLIGVLPLVIIGPLAYSLVRNILLDRVRSTTVEVNDRLFLQLQGLVGDTLTVLDAIATDQTFLPLYASQISQEQQTNLYNALFLLLTARHLKPAVHVVSLDGHVRLNSVETPIEYTQESYRNWGVLRKAFLTQGEAVLYLHASQDSLGRIFSLARHVKQASFEGFIILDIGYEQLKDILDTHSTAHFPYVAILDEHKTSSRILNGIFTDEELDFIRQSSLSIHTPVSINDGQRYQFSIQNDRALAFSLVSLYPLAQIDEITSIVATISISLGTLMTLLCFYLAYRYSRKASKPLDEVVACLKRVSEGDFSARTHIIGNDEFGVLGESVNEMVMNMERLLLTNQQKEQSLRTAQIKALQAQTRPHFIFNCLELVKWYILLNQSEEASATIVELGLLLRSTLDLAEGMITLEEELAIVSHYLALQQRRMGERLSVECDIDSTLNSLTIPRFLLQPLVENALMHGLEKKRGKGRLTIGTKREDAAILFTISDDGVGMESERAKGMASYREIIDAMQEGTGLQNVQRRLTLNYGSACEFFIRSDVGKGTTITIRIQQEVLQWKKG